MSDQGDSGGAVASDQQTKDRETQGLRQRGVLPPGPALREPQPRPARQARRDHEGGGGGRGAAGVPPRGGAGVHGAAVPLHDEPLHLRDHRARPPGTVLSNCGIYLSTLIYTIFGERAPSSTFTLLI